MRAPHVDFARPARWPVAALWAGALALACAAGWAAARQYTTWNSLGRERDQTAQLFRQLDGERAVQAARAASAVAPPAFAADARRLMAMSVVDIGCVLRSLEAVRVTGVKVLRLDVDATTRKVEVELDVSSADAATTYLQALNAGEDHPVWVLSRMQLQGSAQSALIRARMP